MRIRLLLGLVCSLLALTIISCGGGSSSAPISSNPVPSPSPTPTVGDFKLILEFASVAAQQGGSQQGLLVSVASVSKFSGTVNFTVSGVPAGVTALPLSSVSVPVSGELSSDAEFTASTAALVGSSTITITGTSGNLTHSATFQLNIRQAAPFALQISSSSVTLTPPSTTNLEVSITSDPSTSPQVFLSISDVPANSQIAIGSPQRLLTPTTPFSMPITAPILAQQVQNFPITLTASDNNNNTSIATFLISVTAPPPANITPTRSTFFRTDQAPTGILYDQTRKLLFVSVETLDEILVLSSTDGHEVASIPASFPGEIDESADGSAIYVVSPLVPGVTTIDPGSLQVIRHSNVPAAVSGNSQPVTFFQLATLSNGKVLFRPTFDVPIISLQPFYLWDPATDTFSLFGSNTITDFVDLITRSPDHTKVFGYGTGTSGGILYDVTTDTFSGPNPAIAGSPMFSPDGSQFATLQFLGSSEVLAFYDTSFNLLGSIPLDELSFTGSVPRIFYSLDGRLAYAVPDEGIGAGSSNALAFVIDTTTFNAVGMVPSFAFGATIPFSGQVLTSFALDETGMVFGSTPGGVAFLDMTSPTFLKLPMPSPFQVQPGLASLSAPTIANLNGNGFAQGLPLNLLIGPSQTSAQSRAATNLVVQNNNLINATIPAGAVAGPANATLTRSDGFFEVVPDAVTFGPTILQIDANAGSTAGGDTIKIVGYGLSRPGTQVSIGGRLASITSQTPAVSGQFFPTERITLTTPAGVAGLANVTVSTPSGSTTVAGGFQYLDSVQQHPVVGLLDAIAYDQARQRLYISNQDHNRVEVFNLSTNTLGAPVTVGTSPTVLNLTTDGALLTVLNRGDNTISVIDLSTLTVTATYSLLTASDSAPFCQGVAINFTPAAGHRALVDIGCSALAENGLFHLINLDTGSLDCTGVAGCGTNGTDIKFGTGLAALASTPDGSKIFLATTTGGGSPLPTELLDLTANTLTAGSSGDFNDAAANADGTRFAGNFVLFNGPTSQNFMAFEPYAPDAGAPSIHNVPGEKLNPSGSLLFCPQNSGVDIFDTHTGRLVTHVSLPGSVPANSNAMVLDETGTKVFLTSTTGLTIAQLFQAPLSIGTVNPASGPQGTVVTLRGSGFANGATISFNNIQATTSFVDSNTLQATVPALSAGPARVSVRNPDGHQYSLDLAYTVN